MHRFVVSQVNSICGTYSNEADWDGMGITDVHITLVAHVHPSVVHPSVVHTSMIHSRIWTGLAGSNNKGVQMIDTLAYNSKSLKFQKDKT